MARVAVVADSHFCEDSRFDECVRLHQWIADNIETRDVQLVVHTGDVYERKSTPLERAAAAEWVRAVAEHAPVLIVRGNHDAIDDLPLFERLATSHQVVVEQAARVHVLGGVAVAAMAWPRKSALLAASGAEGKEFGEQVAGDALRAVLRGLALELDLWSGPKLFAAHAMVRGSETSTGQPLVGHDMELGLEDLALAGAQAYLLGHIHKSQAWHIGNAPVIYPGSPRRTAFGELEPKGYVIVDVSSAGDVTWEFVEAPATPMFHVTNEWGVGEDGSFGWLAGAHGEPESVAGAELRFRYHVPSNQREGARAAALVLRDRWLAEGATLVKVEEVVIAEARSRTPEVARAVTLRDKLEAFWVSKSFDPGARRSALLEKVVKLEEEHHAT